MSWFFWFRLVFRCLFPFSSLFSFLQNGVLFHHDFLVPGGSGSGAGACLPSSFFFLFSGNCFLFPGSGSSSGACLPSSLFFLFSGKGFCSIMICWLLPVPARVRVVVSLFISSFFFQETGLCSIMISWFLLVPVLAPVLVSLLSFVRKRVLFQFNFLVSPCPARVPVLMSLLLPSFHFLRKTVLFRHDCMVPFLLRLLVFLFRFHL